MSKSPLHIQEALTTFLSKQDFLTGALGKVKDMHNPCKVTLVCFHCKQWPIYPEMNQQLIYHSHLPIFKTVSIVIPIISIQKYK